MNSQPEREYATQADYAEWVRESTEERSGEIVAALRKAFQGVIRKEEFEVIVFSELTASELADRLLSFPLILKPLLLASNIAARAIERDLGIRNLNTYDCRLSKEQSLSISGYIKPFLPDSLPLPTLAELDRVMFADKEIRKTKGRWEGTVIWALNSYSTLIFKKSKFQHNGQTFELDAAAKDALGNILHAVDVKRIEARRDIHKRTDEIVNKGSHLKAAYPKVSFGAVIYYPFISEHGNVRDRLQSPYVDSVVFAGASKDSVVTAVKLLLGKFKCLKS
ncbi:MAG: hypothetical protein HYX84_03765 [Chloroflexi bacterium]|nr:hypothetical protein [Chloroflexota bacterium]